MKKKPGSPRVANQLASFIAAIATGKVTELRTDDGKNAAAVALGRMGGLKGGRIRAERLSPGKRSEIAKKAATARWGRKDGYD